MHGCNYTNPCCCTVVPSYQLVLEKKKSNTYSKCCAYSLLYYSSTEFAPKMWERNQRDNVLWPTNPHPQGQFGGPRSVWDQVGVGSGSHAGVG